jgi:two-component system nitrogen regulation sensor histidine kinase NtrY
LQIADHLPDHAIFAKFDRRLLSQALTNIVKNATEAIGAIDNETRGGPGRIAVTLAEDDLGIVSISVRDNGKGFPQENRARLLEPYMTTREGGTGLGLAIVGKILEDHGGGLELLDPSDGSRGAIVRLWFPRDGAVDTPHSEPTDNLRRNGSVA